MDAFWCITLGTLVIAWFWKRENRKSAERKYDNRAEAERTEKQKQDVEIAKWSAKFMPEPVSPEDLEAERALKEAQKQRDRDIAELRKQGYTDELIAAIIPTINNGQ